MLEENYEELKDSLIHLDIKGDGTVTVEQLLSLLNNYGASIQKEQLVNHLHRLTQHLILCRDTSPKLSNKRGKSYPISSYTKVLMCFMTNQSQQYEWLKWKQSLNYFKFHAPIDLGLVCHKCMYNNKEKLSTKLGDNCCMLTLRSPRRRRRREKGSDCQPSWCWRD